MNKICTSIEQSKKLLEIGIDVNTADMYWWYNTEEKRYEASLIDYAFISDMDIPAWSLSALLSIIPKHIGDSVFRMDMGETDINLWFDDLSSRTVDEILPDITKENFVDAAFEMICWLLENGYIKKGE